MKCSIEGCSDTNVIARKRCYRHYVVWKQENPDLVKRHVRTLTIDEYKTCSKCFEWRPVKDYYKRASGALLAQCKACVLREARERKLRTKP